MSNDFEESVSNLLDHFWLFVFLLTLFAIVEKLWLFGLMLLVGTAINFCVRRTIRYLVGRAL